MHHLEDVLLFTLIMTGPNTLWSNFSQPCGKLPHKLTLNVPDLMQYVTPYKELDVLLG